MGTEQEPLASESIAPRAVGGASDKFNNDIIFHVANATIADLTAKNNYGHRLRRRRHWKHWKYRASRRNGPSATPAPEPGSLLLFGTALAALGLFVGRRRKIV